MQDWAIIKVQVTEKDGVSAYGTAYRIDRYHAITALHVVTNYKKISFIFYGNKCTNKFKIDFLDNDFDVAVLRFNDENFVNTLPDVKRLIIRRAKNDDRWEGAGYPKFTELIESKLRSRKLEDLKGSCGRFHENGNVFEVSEDKIPKLEKWGGVSGSPVFLMHSNKLVGVILTTDTATENSYFGASALWKLYTENEQFKKYFAYRQGLEQVVKKSRDYLDSADNASLNDVLKEFGDDPDKIIDYLSTTDLIDVLDQLDTLKRTLDVGLAEKLNTLVLTFLPYYFSDKAIVIDDTLVQQPHLPIDLQCVGEVAAECCMAAFNGRAAHLEHVAGEKKHSDSVKVAQNSVALTAEMGIGRDKQEKQAIQAQVLASKGVDAVFSELETYIKKWYWEGQGDPENAFKRALLRAKKDNENFYLVMYLDEKNKEDKLKKIKQYREQYEDLIILSLSLDKQLADEEQDQFNWLPSILKM